MKKLLLIVITPLLIASCTSLSQSNLYWGNYSSTLYKMKKEPSPKTIAAHKDELKRIIEKSKELNILVPPGIQAELGYMLLNEGKKSMALGLLNGEGKTYPESKVFMTKIYQQVRKKTRK